MDQNTKQKIPEPTRRAQMPVEVQKVLGISNSSFYKLVREGKIRTIKIGASTRVPPDEVERLITQGT
jgi:excisionase family DNA binding protein